MTPSPESKTTPVVLPVAYLLTEGNSQDAGRLTEEQVNKLAAGVWKFVVVAAKETRGEVSSMSCDVLTCFGCRMYT